MKKLLFPLICILTVNVCGQVVYSPSTYYVIPPTIGCNGVWAVKDSLFFMNCTYSGFGCAFFNHRNGDTLFLDLCYIPCEIWAACDTLPAYMLCKVDWATGIEDIKQSGIRVYQKDNFICVDNSGSDIESIELFDLNGRILAKARASSDDPINIMTEPERTGLFILNIHRRDKTTSFFKIVKH